MIVYPHAKINLGLHILQKRSDGFHQIETLLYPVELCDILEIKPSDQIRLFLYGLPIEGNPQENLCLKAWEMLRADFAIPPVQFHLYKRIPCGAGLGGGSSDGAFTLKLLDNYFSLGLSEEQLISYAARLGSDCPSFIFKRPSMATGKGDQIAHNHLDISPLHILICKPPLFISTARAYALASPGQHKYPLQETLSLPLSLWRDNLINDFESALFPVYPILQKYKETLYDSGALYASLSGSGSALYGLYDSEQAYKEGCGQLGATVLL
ncbi:MAG: 4-(cytidine 5'-diphospho)-2-C-methyl-D-erythritol kinase [Bacteroidetes bacterium]|nr:4-(cytidine 5'-diphospho)-2-C-methyl-D-erythritol kinase [Bacteroidota bacterium]